MHSKSFIFLIIIQLLVAQIGVNIFSSYCCCLKRTTVSFLPRKDKCFTIYNSKDSKPQVKHCNRNTHVKKGSCSKQDITFNSSKALGFTNSQDSFNVQVALYTAPIPLNHIAFSFTPYEIIFSDTLPYCISGIDRRIRMSSLLC